MSTLGFLSTRESERMTAAKEERRHPGSGRDGFPARPSRWDSIDRVARKQRMCRRPPASPLGGQPSAHGAAHTAGAGGRRGHGPWRSGLALAIYCDRPPVNISPSLAWPDLSPLSRSPLALSRAPLPSASPRGAASERMDVSVDTYALWLRILSA